MRKRERLLWALMIAMTVSVLSYLVHEWSECKDLGGVLARTLFWVDCIE